MTSERTRDALTLFREACELPVDERTAFLDRACGQNAELRAEVESMLAWDDVEDEDETTHPVRAALSDLADQAKARQAEGPASIGGYRIVRLLAQGGMGVVYEAQQENPARRVALKVARTGGTTGERARRFELEAQLLARLRHPGIAQIFEAGTTSPEDGTQPFFVMEYVDGQPLTDYADTHLDSARARLELMVRVCEAVAFAHAQGVVHRDLKPDNVLIEPGGAPKVLDFGVAKVQEAGGFGTATLRTEAGRVLGTMGYMAPEQLAGRTEGLGPAADVYSLGVMLYELLTGRLPHDLTAATLTRALAIVTSTDAPLLGVVRPEYRGDIEAVAAKALEKDPRHRYADAGELAADLRRYLRDEPVVARRHSAFHRARKFARRHRGLVGGVAATLVALTLGLIAALYFLAKFQGKVREFDQLAVSSRYQRLLEQEPDIYPAWPRNIGAMNAWLEECREIRALEDDIERTVESLLARRESLDEAARFLLTTLEPLLSDLPGLADHEAIARKALTWAGRIETLSKDHPNAAVSWADARAAIAKADGVVASELYSGQEIRFGDGAGFVMGLVPIGMNPVTQLWEFYHLRTAWDGESDPASIPIPTHDPDGSIEVTGATGLVFVLIPGGRFWMGAQDEDPELPHYSPVVIHDSPPHVVEVEPFFLSKYEMTQGQWLRTTGENLEAPPPSLTKPVNGVSWTACHENLPRLGLILPHEKQWEYAIRGGEGDKPLWWTGDAVESLAGKENVFDLTTLEWHPKWPLISAEKHAPFEDEKKRRRLAAGDRGPAPVGTYAANAFGLYDMGGNVSEWCSNEPYQYPDVLVNGAGRAVRGSNHRRAPYWARTTARLAMPEATARQELGLRPAMAIRP